MSTNTDYVYEDDYKIVYLLVTWPRRCASSQSNPLRTRQVWVCALMETVLPTAVLGMSRSSDGLPR